MKKILIATALAGAIVGTFASLSFAAPLPTRLDNGVSSNIINVDRFCGPDYRLERGFRDRYGRWIPPRCIRERVYRPYYYRP
jgi:hypothetical protein